MACTYLICRAQPPLLLPLTPQNCAIMAGSSSEGPLPTHHDWSHSKLISLPSHCLNEDAQVQPPSPTDHKAVCCIPFCHPQRQILFQLLVQPLFDVSACNKLALLASKWTGVDVEGHRHCGLLHLDRWQWRWVLGVGDCFTYPHVGQPSNSTYVPWRRAAGEALMALWPGTSRALLGVLCISRQHNDTTMYCILNNALCTVSFTDVQWFLWCCRPVILSPCSWSKSCSSTTFSHFCRIRLSVVVDVVVEVIKSTTGAPFSNLGYVELTPNHNTNNYPNNVWISVLF